LSFGHHIDGSLSAWSPGAEANLHLDDNFAVFNNVEVTGWVALPEDGCPCFIDLFAGERGYFVLELV